jgi:regulator of protease activity HflC (stomatin/prohibitin superfamily)
LRLIGVDGSCWRKRNVWLLQAVVVVVVVVVVVGYGYYSFFVVRQNSAKLLPRFFCFALAIDDAMRWGVRALIQRALNQRASSSSPRVLPLPAQAVFPVQLSWVEKILKKF